MQNNTSFFIVGLLVSMFVVWSQAAAAESLKHLIVHVPAAEGSGWHMAARAVQKALIKQGLVENVEIQLSPGAGGLIGLAQFVGGNGGDTPAIFITGSSMLGAEVYNRSLLSLSDVTPVARLIGTVLAFAVPKKSPFQNLGDLIETNRTHPELVRWVGGSAGGVDEQLVYEFAKALGISRNAVDYTATPGGGDEVTRRVLEDQYTVAVNSYEEFLKFTNSGQIRVLAVTAGKAWEAEKLPMLLDYGLGISHRDWRGVFTHGNVDKETLQLLEVLIAELVTGDAWAAELKVHHWEDLFLARNEFSTFVTEEKNRLRTKVVSEKTNSMPLARLIEIVGRHYRWTILAAILVAVLIVIVALQRLTHWKKETRLTASLNSSRQETNRVSEEFEKNLARATGHVEEEFDRWQLTEAENEIGWMMLKGLSFKEIAVARGTSERTVRQQAQAIYAKSGLQSRKDLAAYFLEDLCFG